MSGQVITRYVLKCDGCGNTVPEGHNGEFANAIEARAAAYAANWRFPSRTRVNGQPGRESSDVCPSCLPTWQGAPATDTHKNRRGGGRTR